MSIIHTLSARLHLVAQRLLERRRPAPRAR